MATTTNQLPARSLPSHADTGHRQQPFVLWEGGLGGASGERGGDDHDSPVLAIALEGEPLPLYFPCEPLREVGDFEGSERVTEARGPLRTLLFAALCALTILCFALGSLMEGAELAAYRDSLVWEPHVVCSGETLRSILDSRELPPVESGRLVHWVEEMNDLPNATIFAGQRLLMPEWHE